MTDRERQAAHNALQRRYYTRTDRQSILPAQTPYIERQLDEAIQAAAITTSDRVIDVGCGRGRHLFGLAERGLNVEGLELSEDLLACLRADDVLGIPGHCGDIAAPPPELHAQYDVAVGFFVLHHLLDLESAFRGIASLLRPGGRVAFIEPNPANPLFWVQITCSPSMRWSAERGIFNMRLPKLRRAMTDAGLTDVRVRRYGFLPPVFRNTRVGEAVDNVAESIRLIEPVLPFQVFSARRST